MSFHFLIDKVDSRDLQDILKRQVYVFAQHLSTAFIMSNIGTANGSAKRPHSELEDPTPSAGSNGASKPAAQNSSSDEEDMGPALPSSAPAKKKRRILKHEALYVAALPLSQRYSKSLMHKDQLSFVTITPNTDFLITSSVDGQVSFWKKVAGSEAVEFVKEFRAHTGEIKSVGVSWDGRSFASCGADKTVKIWDVVTFDLVTVINVDTTPSCVCWVHRRGAGVPLVALGNEVNGDIAIYDGRGEGGGLPLRITKGVHRRSVIAMAYNKDWDCVVSADEGGLVEYWQPEGSYEKPQGLFEIKSQTSLFEFKKVCSSSTCRALTMLTRIVEIGPNSHHYLTEL